jgi:tetratricopeptide (TPR) repeat protein
MSIQPRKRYVPAVGPRLKQLLLVVFGLFALLAINSVYLSSITVLEWVTGLAYQNYFYQYMFLAHLVLGAAVVVPVVVFGVLHLRNARTRPNRRAVQVGYALFAASLLLLATGIILTRLEFFEVRNPNVRGVAYWLHVATPFVVTWLFVLHRLAGPAIHWKVGGAWAAVAVGFAVLMVAFHSQDPRQWNLVGPASGEKYFFPSLARTANGAFIPARTLTDDQYCRTCHADTHEKWAHSAHRFSSFNNPAYLFSVRETRKVSLERDGNVQASRFCAGCHDPAPFFSGAFDDPSFDDVNHPTAQAGITCSSCHSITAVNSNRGNGDYTIEEPTHYPFAYSDNAALRWVNRQLVKSKPEFHKKTFLKPIHKSAEFCGTCHKVHLPVELNQYKWLRGQNHYDSYLLSGVSGHGVQSFYYPPKATPNCSGCHMPLQASKDFGARYFDDSKALKVHDHQFPSANTALAKLLGLPDWVNDSHRRFLEGVVRVDLFGVRHGGTIEGALTAPLRPEVPTLEAGKTYLLDTVIRTMKVGHEFTQGTADSNEIWLDVRVTSGDRVLGRSGGQGEGGAVDPWSHFVNVYMLDREGNRIDRRNPQDIFVPLYNHQIPPGAADVVHYRLQVPPDAVEPITVEARLLYRKFDTTYMKLVFGADHVNDLPVTTLATDRVTFPVAAAAAAAVANPASPIDPWQRWNDYGIGLLRKGNTGSSKGELRQAEHAFLEVERLGRPDGPLNRARVYIKEGRLDDAVAALKSAAEHDPPAPPWSVAWFTGLVNKQNGFLDEAIADFTRIVENKFTDAAPRGFDFSRDYNLLNELGQTLFERAKLERGEAKRAERDRYLGESQHWFERTLAIDSENAMAHYNLGLLFGLLGDQKRAQQHQQLFAKYRPDDNARDRAIAVHRRANPAANHAAEAIVIYDLHRDGAFELAAPPLKVARR